MIEDSIKSEAVDIKEHDKDQQTPSDSRKETNSCIRSSWDSQQYRREEKWAIDNALYTHNIQIEANDFDK